MSTKFGNFRALPSPSFKKSSKLPANAKLTQQRDIRGTMAIHQDSRAAKCVILKTAMFRVQVDSFKKPRNILEFSYYTCFTLLYGWLAEEYFISPKRVAGKRNNIV